MSKYHSGIKGKAGCPRDAGTHGKEPNESICFHMFITCHPQGAVPKSTSDKAKRTCRGDRPHGASPGHTGQVHLNLSLLPAGSKMDQSIRMKSVFVVKCFQQSRMEETVSLSILSKAGEATRDHCDFPV